MRIPSAVVDQYIPFVGYRGSDGFTRQTDMQGKFLVYRSRNGADWTAMTTPLVTEGFSSTAPGCYWLLADEDMTIDAGNYSEVMAFHITTTDTALSTDSIVPVTVAIELYNDRMTTATGGLMTILDNVANLDVSLETATDMLSNIQDVLIPAIETSITYATRGIDQIIVGLEAATSGIDAIRDVDFAALETSITYATRGIDQLIVEHAAMEVSLTYATRGIDQIALGIAAATDGVSLLTSSQVVRESTVGLSGGTPTTINLDASAHATNDFYKDEIAYISAGSQGGGAVVAGQARLVTAYNGTTKVATIAPPWVVTPTEGNTFVILPSAYLPGMEYATDGISSIQDVLLPAIETSITYATRGIDQILLGLETATDLIFDINANTVAAEVSLTYATRGIDQIITTQTAHSASLEFATDKIFDIDANVTAAETSLTYATRGIDQILLGLEYATDPIFDINANVNAIETSVT